MVLIGYGLSLEGVARADQGGPREGWEGWEGCAQAGLEEETRELFR